MCYYLSRQSDIFISSPASGIDRAKTYDRYQYFGLRADCQADTRVDSNNLIKEIRNCITKNNCMSKAEDKALVEDKEIPPSQFKELKKS
jgi:hypothetical protein